MDHNESYMSPRSAACVEPSTQDKANIEALDEDAFVVDCFDEYKDDDNNDDSQDGDYKPCHNKSSLEDSKDEINTNPPGNRALTFEHC